MKNFKTRTKYKFTQCTALILAVATTCSITACGSRETKHYDEEITVDVFDSVANFQGMQAGWFGQLVKDKFNMRLNIIAPNRSYNGDVLQEVRAASGNVGDLIIFTGEGGALSDMIQAGLLYDMSEDLQGKEIQKYGDAITALNASAGTDGVYAIPSSISTLSPLEPQSILEPTYSPYVRWDIYSAIGYPELKTLEDLLPVLKKMQEASPVSDSGKPTYGFSFFKEWDDNMMNAAKQPCCFYGYDEEGFVLAKADSSEYQDILADDSIYMRVLHFFFEANQMGLIDPDSQIQNYSEVFDKYADGQVLFSPWPFLGQSAYNSEEHLNEGKGFMVANIQDMQVYEYGCANEGTSKTVIGIGSDAQDPERLADFIDWLYSDEGVYANQAQPNAGTAGPLGICWERKSDGPVLTEYGEKTFLQRENVLFPNGEYEGGFQEGVSMLNYTPVLLKQTDSYGYPYSYTLWDSERQRSKSLLEQRWSSYMNATDSMDYLEKNNKLQISPVVSYTAAEEGAEIKEIRKACKRLITEGSWKMVFAADEEQFQSLKEEMQTNCRALGYDKVYQYDLQSATEKGELKKAVNP